MDAFLLIVVIILAIMLIISSFYLLVYYCHPDDAGFGTTLFCKILVVFGITLCWCQTLLLPLDVSNVRNDDGGLDMKALYYIVYILIAIFCLILLPFGIFFYETDEEKPFWKRIVDACYYEIASLIASIVILLLTWAFLQYSDVPVESYVSNKLIASTEGFSSSDVPEGTSATLEIKVSFPVYVIALLSFVGWFLFMVFGSVGLVALPLDLILQFRQRPIIKSSQEAFDRKNILKKQCAVLMEDIKEIKNETMEVETTSGWWAKRRQKNRVKSLTNQFKNAVLCLENDFEIFNLEVKISSTNPLVYYGKLVLGILFIIISFLWWLQILFNTFVRKNGYIKIPFLNNLLNDCQENNAAFIATAIFGGLCLYLLWATMKGVFKVGIRVPCLFTFHPMKQNETWMNSFLFNILLLLFCSISLTQFCLDIFSEYARFTTMEQIFGIQVKYMRFYKYFFDHHVFDYIFFIMSVLTVLYFICRPHDKPKALKEIEERRQQKFK